MYAYLNRLFKSAIITIFHKYAQQPDLTFKSDIAEYPIFAKHFEKEIDDIDIPKTLADREVTHLNVPSAQLGQVRDTLSKNHQEIHINYKNIELNELIEVKERVIEDYFDKMLYKKKQELELLEYKIKVAKDGSKSAKSEFILALINGATIQEALATVRSSKYNDIDTEYFLQDLRVDLINVSKLEKITKEQSSIINKQNIDIQNLHSSIENLKIGNERTREKNSNLEKMIYETALKNQELLELYEDAKEHITELKLINKEFEETLDSSIKVIENLKRKKETRKRK
jgi:hypothetical protein